MIHFAFLIQGALLFQVSAFRYEPSRVPVGTVYHYLKTNVDGTHPEHIVQYVAAEVFGRTERTTIPSLPFHVYNFDLGSLNLALPHLRNPNGSFTVELADPTYKNQPVFRDRGPVEVRYVEDAVRDGHACRVYRIDGPGLDWKGGTLWVRKDDGLAQDIEIALPDNPSWSSFKLRLERRERMTPAEWEAFRQAHFTR